MISEHTCGLILNIGRYLWPAYITPEILDLCNRHNYPLFTMPWETLICDVTHNYYNRIFEDSRKNELISSALLNLLHGRTEQSSCLSLLSVYGYDLSGSYCTIYIRFHLEGTENQERSRTENHIRLSVSRLGREQNFSMQLCPAGDYILLVCPVNALQKEKQIRAFGVLLSDMLSNRFPELEMYTGCGSTVYSLADLSKSFFHARQAAAYASLFLKEQDGHFASFHQLGFYQILLAVSDRRILKSYSDSLLSSVLIYDRDHRSGCLDTLQEYLYCKGSVQLCAKRLFCHRNTINKRIRIIREELHYDLENPRVIFELYAAFLIREYLEHFPD